MLSVVIPTFNNVDVLRRCLDGWRRHGGADVEVIVIEDGCRDSTPELLRSLETTDWGRRHLRWTHEDDGHELRCTNTGIAAARGKFVLAWQDDMFLRASWLVPELLRTFDRYRDIGMIALSRGLDCHPVNEPIRTYQDLVDWRRLPSTIGPAPWNWIRLQEVDAVIRPWVIRKECIDRVGALDEAFRPTEWDEADLSFRLREGGWRVAACGFERLGAYFHLGSTTISRAPSEPYFAKILENGRLFHARWDGAIAGSHTRERRTWHRRATPAGWIATVSRAASSGLSAARKRP